MDDLAARLGTVRHFHDLPAPVLQAIVSSGRVRRFAQGAMIFAEGGPCSGMFVLLSGRVHLCKFSPRGQRQIISIIEPVIMFNEVAVLDGGPNPVMAVAVEPSVTWSIDCAAFHEFIRLYPQIGLGLLPVLAARNRVLIARNADLAYRPVLARTAKLILDLSQQGRLEISRKQHSVDELSARVGSVREPVSRSLSTLRQEGAITLTRASISVIDVVQLAKCAHIDVLDE